MTSFEPLSGKPGLNACVKCCPGFVWAVCTGSSGRTLSPFMKESVLRKYRLSENSVYADSVVPAHFAQAK